MSSAVTEDIKLTKPEGITYVFNKCFINILSMIQSTIKFSRNIFHVPHDIDIIFFPIKSVHKIEIQNFNFSLNLSESCWPK